MGEEKFFNINTMLKNLFESLDKHFQGCRPNLVFIFSKTVPCQMRGDVTTLYSILFKTLQYILKNRCDSEIILSVDAPGEFLYKEDVSFTLSNIPIKKEALLSELTRILKKDLEVLNSTLSYSEKNGGSLTLNVMLTTAELGCRRHYRLPSTDYLHKNILLVIEKNNLALSVTKMFKYFPMNVDLCINSYKEKYDLSHYDMVLVEDTLFDFRLYDLIEKAQKKGELHLALLGEKDIYDVDDTSKLHVDFLEKPVTQESVYKLLMKVFDDLPIIA